MRIDFSFDAVSWVGLGAVDRVRERGVELFRVPDMRLGIIHQLFAAIKMAEVAARTLI